VPGSSETGGSGVVDIDLGDWRAQFGLEDEGAAAGLLGKTREDCPYDKESQPKKWNHWVIGCEIAGAEKRDFESNEKILTFCSTAPGSWENAPRMTAQDAYKQGIYKPQYYKPDLTKKSS